MNTIIRDVAKLMKTLRKASVEELKEAQTALTTFSDSWLVSGDGSNLEGAGECCLADTDITTPIATALDIYIENQS